MEKSIESIWKNGFMSSNKLVIPKIEEFYNKKSQMSIAKEERKMKISAYLIIPMTIIMIIINQLLGNDLIWGILSAFVMLPWTFIGLYQIKKMQRIDFKENCYEYLLAFKDKRNQLNKFNKLLGLSTIPLIMTPLIIYSCIKKSHETLGEMIGVEGLDISNWYLFALIPIMLLFSYLLSTFIIRRAEAKDPIRKLIMDMEELRKN